MTSRFLYPVFRQDLGFSSVRTYAYIAAFSVANVLLPLFIHAFVPGGGPKLLPIYFFTLVAGYVFGWRVGIITGALSIALNFFLTGMPPAPALPFVFGKSIVLGTIAGLVSPRYLSLPIPVKLILIVLVYQILGALVGALVQGNPSQFIGDLSREMSIGYLGIVIQIVGGTLVIGALQRIYGREAVQ